MRGIRLMFLNLQGKHTAYARLIPGSSTLRITIYPAVKDIGFVPSAHYFLYIPNRLTFWESHPFTAASWRPAPPEGPPKVKAFLEGVKRENSTSSSIPMLSRSSSTKSRKQGKPKLTFLVTARKGMTASLLARLQEAKHHTIKLPCYLEGPYGTLKPIHAFHTVVLIAGGVGISTSLPYLQEHILAAVPALKFTLVWTVREEELAANVLHRVQELRERRGVCIKVYITGEQKRKDLVFPPGVRVRYRRPRIVEQIVKAANEREWGTSMAVISCGSGAVVDDARRGAVEALHTAAGRDGRGDVVYWEEAQGW